MEKTIIIDKILMNYIDFETREMAFSSDFVDLSNSKTLDYYHKKIEKTLCNNSLTPIVNVDKDVLNEFILCADDNQMIYKAQDITNKLGDLGRMVDYIPNTNVMFVKFRVDDIPFLGIIKLNFKELPKMTKTEKSNKMSILLTQKQQFPSSPSKADEAIFIDLSKNEVYIVEKKFSIDGKKDFYLNECWLKGEKLLTDKQKINYLIKTLRKVNDIYCLYDEDMLVVLRNTIIDNNSFNIYKVVDEILEESENANNEAKLVLSDLGINEEDTINYYNDVSLSKIVTFDDIEIKIPTDEMLGNKLDIIRNSDATFNIILNNVSGFNIK